MLYKKKKEEVKSFDRTEQYPVIRSSICTGEKVAGFKDRKHGHFTEIMLIRNEKDMDEFLKTYELQKGDVKTEY